MEGLENIKGIGVICNNLGNNHLENNRVEEAV
jgi:hypothetical protein